MKTDVNAPQTSAQIWLWGLMSVAWADGHFDESEQDIIREFWEDKAFEPASDQFEQIPIELLVKEMGQDPETAENFMRTAVMVALADGLYSTAEDEILEKFCQGLGLNLSVLAQLRTTLDGKHELPDGVTAPPGKHGDLLEPVRSWLDGVDIKDPKVARFLCRLIPADCPFERDVVLFGQKIVHIPPMCKINPLYEQLVGLRFRSLSFLADDCQEDVTPYL